MIFIAYSGPDTPVAWANIHAALVAAGGDPVTSEVKTGWAAPLTDTREEVPDETPEEEPAGESPEDTPDDEAPDPEPDDSVSEEESAVEESVDDLQQAMEACKDKDELRTLFRSLSVSERAGEPGQRIIAFQKQKFA